MNVIIQNRLSLCMLILLLNGIIDTPAMAMKAAQRQVHYPAQKAVGKKQKANNQAARQKANQKANQTIADQEKKHMAIAIKASLLDEQNRQKRENERIHQNSKHNQHQNIQRIPFLRDTIANAQQEIANYRIMAQLIEGHDANNELERAIINASIASLQDIIAQNTQEISAIQPAARPAQPKVKAQSKAQPTPALRLLAAPPARHKAKAVVQPPAPAARPAAKHKAKAVVQPPAPAARPAAKHKAKASNKVTNNAAHNAAKNTITIPSQLKNKYTFQLTQLRSTQQKGLTCGFWATANACAMRSQSAQNLPITSAKTDELAQFYFENILKNHAVFAQCLQNGSIRFQTNDEILNLAQSLFVTIDDNSIPGLYIVSSDSMPSFFGDNTVESILNRTRMIDRLQHGQDLHYIINSGGHWTSLSVLPKIENGNRTYETIYLDSLNSSISSNRTINDVLAQINTIIQELV